MFNRSEVFRLAWVWARQDLWSARAPKSALRRFFAAALKRAWADAKSAAAHRAAAKPSNLAALSVAQLRAAIVSMENTDGLRWAGINCLSELRRALAEAQGRQDVQTLAA